jgi:hypothetical protein
MARKAYKRLSLPERRRYLWKQHMKGRDPAGDLGDPYTGMRAEAQRLKDPEVVADLVRSHKKDYGIRGRIAVWQAQRNDAAVARGKKMRRRASRSRSRAPVAYYNDPISRPPVFGMVPMARKDAKGEGRERKEVPKPFFPVTMDQGQARYNAMHGGVSFGPAPRGSFPVTMGDAGLRGPQASGPGGRGPSMSFPVTLGDMGMRYPQASGRMPRYDSVCGARCSRMPRYPMERRGPW